MHTNKKVLGIDPGYERCGFAILSGNSHAPILTTFGTIKTPAQNNFAERLREIDEDIRHLLTKHKPTHCAIEDLFFAKNVTTALKVSAVRGVIILAAHQHGCQILEPKPVEIKSNFTGNGKSSKKEMQKMAEIMFKLKNSPKLDDGVDAIAAAFWALGR